MRSDELIDLYPKALHDFPDILDVRLVNECGKVGQVGEHYRDLSSFLGCNDGCGFFNWPTAPGTKVGSSRERRFAVGTLGFQRQATFRATPRARRVFVAAICAMHTLVNEFPYSRDNPGGTRRNLPPQKHLRKPKLAGFRDRNAFGLTQLHEEASSP
jgi:hypothetical protein